MSSRGTFTLSVLAGAAAAVLAYMWFTGKERELAQKSLPVPVLTAKRQIPSGARMDPEALEIRRMPRAFVQPFALTSMEEAKGQIAIAPISAGEQILANKLTTGGIALSLAISPGKRAVTISVNAASGVAGLLRPGDLVDVVVTEGAQSLRTFVFMQAATVLGVGSSFSPDSPERPSGLFGPASPATVTLEASPFEAERMAHLENTSRIKLVLRSPGDRERIPLPAISGRQAGRAAAADSDEGLKRR